jgi:pimeloyl-ACP methyl ester carboxylesterase
MDTQITRRNRRSPLYLLQSVVWSLVAVSLVSAGCSSTQYIKKREETTNPLVSWGLLSPDLPPLSERSEKLFRRYDLAKASTEERLSGLQAEIVREPTPEKLIAFSELSYLAGLEAKLSKNDSLALDHFCSSLTHAYWYLFDSGYDLFRNPYDPQFRGACDLYNAALQGALKIAHEEGKLVPGTTYLVETGTRQFRFEIVNRGPWHADEFSKFEFVNDYETPGLTNRHHTYGLGVPLVAVRRQHEAMDPAEQFYPPGLSFAVTAFLRVNSTLDSCQNPGQTRHCVLELYDPLQVRNIEVAGRQVPLETDLTTSLAYFLDNPEFTENKTNIAQLATWALLLPDLASPVQGMYMVEPYDPRKIPVIMVHGLWSSPVTWMEMFNDLRSFPEIRQQYQFWFYLYPTGQPFWISARQLREDLDEMRRTLDPEFTNPMLNQMVLVGHSMGGLVSKMQTVESGDNYWRLLSDRPFSELKADEETREKLAATVYFHPNPAVRRVITIGTPHRGSDFANDYTRWISRKLISLPEMLVRATQGLTLMNPGFFKNTDLLTVSTSIDSLAPDSPVLPLLLDSPRAPWTKYHNIVGLVEDDGSFVSSLAAGSDGIVSFRSAHLDEIESEETVPADHVNVHRHPRAILEVRRILLLHRDQALAELQGLSGMTPASFGQPVEPPNAWP